MSDLVRQQAPLILEKVHAATHILLHCHPSPDPDSVGSTLAMKRALEQLGKKVTLIQGDSSIPQAFVFPGVETITKKSYDEVMLDDFDLFIILDSGSLEMVSKKIPVKFPPSMMTVVIDHHASNKGYGQMNLVDTSYPATAQLLYDLFAAWDIKIDHDIALNLFMGIYTDTGGFKYRGSTSRTLEVASKLAALAPDFVETISIMNNSNRKEQIFFEGLALSSLKLFSHDKIAIVAVSNEDLTKIGVKDEDILTGHISNIVGSISGVELAATLIETAPHVVKMSFRSLEHDVSKLAVTLGGGGHRGAAGATLVMPLSQALEKVLQTAKEMYNL